VHRFGRAYSGRAGAAIPIPDVSTVRATRTGDGRSAEQEIPVARVEGLGRWFTDCGSPVAWGAGRGR